MILANDIFESSGYILRNLNTSATQTKGTWKTGTGYGFYGTTLEKPLTLNHYYYCRYTYKFTTTNQSPTWVNYYLYGGYQGGVGKSGGLSANTEYTPSGIVIPSMGGPWDPYSMVIFNGNSNAISGVTSYVKDVLVYDVTDLFYILRSKNVITNSTDSLKTWCDNNLIYMPTGMDYDISEHTVILPKEYQQLDYIRATGSQTINTGLTFDNNAAPLRLNFTVMPETTSGNACLAGCGNSTWNGPIMLNFCAGRMEFGCSGYTAAGSYTSGVKYVYNVTFDKTSQTGYQDGTSFLTASKTYAGSTGSLFLFCFATNSSATGSTYFIGRLYHMVIYDSTGLRAQFIPCRRTSDLAVGVYNTVSKQFLTAAGLVAGNTVGSSGSIVKFAGPNISTDEIIETDSMRAYSVSSTLRDNCYFDTGSSVSVYNNNGNGTVTHARVAAKEQDSPFAGEHPYVLKIETNGSASPYAGGFVASHTSAANKVFIEKFVAKVPVGWNVECAYNSQGSGSSVSFITPKAGTGKWEEYAILYRCGSSGSFSTGGHVMLSGGSTGKNLIPWELDPYHWTIQDYSDRTTHYYKGRVLHFDAVAGNTSDTGLVTRSTGSFNLSANTTYTLSFNVRTNHITSLASRANQWGINLQNGSNYYALASAISINANGEWQRVSGKITTGSATSYTLNLCVEEDLIGTGKYFEISDVMLSTSTDTTYKAYDVNNHVTWYLAYANNCDITGKESLMNFVALTNKTSMKAGKTFSDKLNTVNILTWGNMKGTESLPTNWYYDETDFAGNSTRSLVQPVGASAGYFGPWIRIDPMNRYKLSYWIKCKQDMSSFLTAVIYSNYEGGGWSHQDIGYKPGTKTTLSAALNNGDTQMQVASNSNWGSRSYSRVGFRSYGSLSYCDKGVSNGYNGSTGLIKGVSSSNIVTFNTAYTGSTMAAGTYVVESFDAGTWAYPISKGSLPTDNTWKYVEGYFGRQDVLWDGSGGDWYAIPANARFMRLYINIYSNSGTVPIKWSDIQIIPIKALDGRRELSVSLS